MRRVLLAIVAATVAAVAHAADRCLDQGGSYNYQIERCDFTRSQPGPGAPCLKAILGTWRVVGHRAPGISALSPEESAAWLGRTGTFEVSRAEFDGQICDNASYVSRVVIGEQFFEEFRVLPEALGLSVDAVCITEIGCPESWIAPGSLLVHSGSTLMTPWDGVFFELDRE